MRDSIEFLIEETGVSAEEAELALDLASFNFEEAIRMLHANRRDILVLKAKFYNSSPHLYGLMLLVANVSEGQKAPYFRLRWVLSDNPNLYETSLMLDWYQFEKEIYRARLSEYSYTALSQSMEKEWEHLVASVRDTIYEVRQAVELGDKVTVREWLNRLMDASMVLRHQLKYSWEGEVMNLKDFRQSPPPEQSIQEPAPVESSSHAGDVFLNLRVALADRLQEGIVSGQVSRLSVSELKSGDTVFVYVLETRESGVYLAELFGGLTENGLAPIEVPVESIWNDDDLIGVRVRFGKAVVGEARLPKNLKIAAQPRLRV